MELRKLFFFNIFILLTARTLFACDISWPSTFDEDTEVLPKLRFKLQNDRNIRFYYVLKNNASIEISHKIYACSGKKLYLVTDDDTLGLFSYIEIININKIKLHFVKKNVVVGELTFTRYDLFEQNNSLDP